MRVNDPILITGSPRSGGSMIAGITAICGGFAGNQIFDPQAPYSADMFENVAIREQIIKPYLIRGGSDKDGHFPLPMITELDMSYKLRNRVVGAMLQQGLEGEQWFYKDSRIALTWPLWHKAFPNAKWIIVRRNPKDIVDACCKTGFMNAYKYHTVRKKAGVHSEREGWSNMVRHYEERFLEISKQPNLCSIELWPEQLADGDYSHMEAVMCWAGLEWNKKAKEWVEPKLWNSKNKRNL